MKKIYLLSVLIFLIFACENNQNNLFIGDWIEDMPANKHFVQGISLNADGSASSIGMATLKYEKWNLSGDKITFSGKSIGNGQTIDFSDTFKIIEITPHTMKLEKNEKYQIKYQRKN